MDRSHPMVIKVKTASMSNRYRYITQAKFDKFCSECKRLRIDYPAASEQTIVSTALYLSDECLFFELKNKCFEGHLDSNIELWIERVVFEITSRIVSDDEIVKKQYDEWFG